MNQHIHPADGYAIMFLLKGKRKVAVPAIMVVVCLSLTAILVIPANVSAEDPTLSGRIGDNLIWEVYGSSSTMVISGIGRMKDGPIALPMYTGVANVIVEEGVTSIGAEAFTYTAGPMVSAVSLPSTLERIEKGAFRGTNLQTVDIPAKVSFIHPEAFFKTTALRSINVHEDNEVYTTFENVMFTKDMMELTAYPASKAGREYLIPDGVRSIGECAFNFARMYEVKIPGSVDYISDWAFQNCDDMLSIFIPDSVVHMGYGSIAFCSKLTRITIGAGLTTVTVDMMPVLLTSVKILHLGKSISNVDKEIRRGLALQTITVDGNNQYFMSMNGVLYNKSATEIVLIPQTMTGKYVMPNSVRYVGSNVFQFSSVTSVVLSESLQAIGSQAFYKNTSIGSIKIPGTVKTIGDRAFADCTKLVAVYFEANVPPSIGSNAFATKNVKEPVLRVYSSMESGFLDNYVGGNSVAYYDSEVSISELDEVTGNPAYIVAIAIAAMAGLVLAEIFVSRKQKQ